MAIETSAVDASIELLKQVGFPIVVALYFMFRVDKHVQESTKAYTELRETVLKAIQGGP